MTLPVRPSSGSRLVGRSGASLSRRGPASISYEAADLVGFERVPPHLAEYLRAAGVLVGVEFVADADQPVAKRRPNGSHYQQLHAWWASESRFVAFEARREMTSAGAGRLRPSGPWEASGTVHEFPSGVTATPSVWRHEMSNTPDGGKDSETATDSPLDALPGPIAKPVTGGETSAWLEYKKGWAAETIVASRVLSNRVRLLRATREATSRRALSSAPWEAKTIDAPTVRTTPFSVMVPSGGGVGSAAVGLPPAPYPPLS